MTVNLAKYDLFYDSTDPTDVPADAENVLYYVDYVAGQSQLPAYKKHCKNLQRTVSISVRPGTDPTTADLCDIEDHAYTIAQGVKFNQVRQAHGLRPGYYCSLSLLPKVKAAMKAGGIKNPVIWIAEYLLSGAPHFISGGHATQYIDPPKSGGHYDKSLVVKHIEGIDPPKEVPLSPVFQFFAHQLINRCNRRVVKNQPTNKAGEDLMNELANVMDRVENL